MKVKELFEMAIRGGNLNSNAISYVKKHQSTWQTAPITANLDDFDIRKCEDVYSLWEKDKFVATASLKMVQDVGLIDNVWVDPEYQGKKIFTKLLLFFRTREGVTKLQFSTVHSDDTYNLLKLGGLTLFKKSWIGKNGEKAPFSVDTIDKFYGAGHWKLMLENNSDFSDFPRFVEGFTQSYDAMINIFNINKELD